MIDFHGWLDTTIGDFELAQVFQEEMGLTRQVGFTDTNCRGYFANWAHQNGALGLLVEFSDPEIDLSALIRATDRLLRGAYDDGEGEYAPDERYKAFTGLKAYTLSKGRTTTYRGFNEPFDTASYIDGETDLCVVERIYRNGWARVTYPVTNGTKTAYCPLSAFIRPNAAAPRTARVGGDTAVYRRPDLSQPIGSVWATDTFWVVDEEDGALQIVYPLDTGGFKLGWIAAG